MKRSCAALVAVLMPIGAIAADCLVSVGDLDFGVVQQLNPQPVDTMVTVRVDCAAELDDLDLITETAEINYLLRVDGGQRLDPLQRALQRIGQMDLLSYNLFTDAGRSLVWGDGRPGTELQGGRMVFSAEEVAGNQRQAVDHLGFARLPAMVEVPPGTYEDQLRVILEF